MRIGLAAGVMFCVSATAAPAAILLSVPAGEPPAAAAPTDRAPAEGKRAAVLPPPAIAGLVGLVALTFAVRPRKGRGKIGLPEVTS